jgi:hypothetical protein
MSAIIARRMGSGSDGHAAAEQFFVPIRAIGPLYTSVGQRPTSPNDNRDKGLKARPINPRHDGVIETRDYESGRWPSLLRDAPPVLCRWHGLV